jgi:hypothetical protein
MKYLFYTAFILTIFFSISYSQDQIVDSILLLSDSLIEAHFGPNYATIDIIDVDELITTPREKLPWNGIICEDPHNQFQHCMIFSYGKYDTIDKKTNSRSYLLIADTEGVGLIKDQKIIWCSKKLIYSNLGESDIAGFADLDGDGNTDIICSQSAGVHGEYEELWIISPTSHGGKIINSVNNKGFTTIRGAADSFEVLKSSGDSKIIRALDADLDSIRTIYYLWNGNKFVRQ